MSKTPSSTVQFVDIADVRDILVLLKDGSLRAVIEVESVNFDLKSNDEQIGILRGYQDFLNALDFPLQIVINSRKLDITGYLALLDAAGQQQTNELLQTQVTEYSRFIKGLSELANIMTKRFFVIVPYYAIEETKTQGNGIGGKLKALFGSAKTTTVLNDENVAKYREKIEQRISVVMAGLNPLGVQTRILQQEELLNMYYGYYNPGQKTT